MPKQRKATSRKPGGQPQNKNALKHGLWAERTETNKKVTLHLKKEINYLEGMIESLAIKLDKIMESQDRIKKDDREDIYLLLEVIEKRSASVNRQAILSGELGELEKEVEEGLFLARQDLGILDYLQQPERTHTKNKRSR
jgi:hypothetical protein